MCEGGDQGEELPSVFGSEGCCAHQRTDARGGQWLKSLAVPTFDHQLEPTSNGSSGAPGGGERHRRSEAKVDVSKVAPLEPFPCGVASEGRRSRLMREADLGLIPSARLNSTLSS